VPPSSHTTAPPLPPPAPDEIAARAEAAWEEHAPLRLTVARGALGLELYEAVEIGPLEVAALSLTLPGLRFPIDLSGGVPMFRNRRGELEHLELCLNLDGLARWLTPRWREVTGPLERSLSIWCAPPALCIGWVGDAGALACDLLWAPVDGDLRLVVAEPRGVGLRAPALGYALRALDSALSGVIERRGRVLTITQPGARIGRMLLPAVGARAPSAGKIRCGGLHSEAGVVRFELDSGFASYALGDRAVRALELADLAADADEALARGELDAARAGYLLALERAPRHPELVRLVAEIDVCVGGRAEAALGMVVESMPATRGGAVAAELFARVGDLEAARQTIAAAASGEAYAPLAALLWARLSELEPALAHRLSALDRAVACAPGLSRPRWARLDARLERGDVEGALADAEHLEAAAIGARARHEACRRAARRLLEAGFVRDAGKQFERSLRYVPDDAAATAGLARAMMDSGRTGRAVSLLERAIQLGERQGRADPEALLDLAKLLAERLQDFPAAIARVRQVPASAERAVEARALEARWRATLGDIVGASLAYARLREAIELCAAPDARWTEWLLEAARFEREVELDVTAAERHLAVALRLAPHDRAIADAYREAAAAVLARRRIAEAPAEAPKAPGDSDAPTSG
jgi:cellulose synthase operon protein C